MPRMRLRPRHRREPYNATHLRQLREGFASTWEPFGGGGISHRDRGERHDCQAVDVPIVRQAWEELRDELLAGVTDPQTIWAYRRFG